MSCHGTLNSHRDTPYGTRFPDLDALGVRTLAPCLFTEADMASFFPAMKGAPVRADTLRRLRFPAIPSDAELFSNQERGTEGKGKRRKARMHRKRNFGRTMKSDSHRRKQTRKQQRDRAVEVEPVCPSTQQQQQQQGSGGGQPSQGGTNKTGPAGFLRTKVKIWPGGTRSEEEPLSRFLQPVD